MVYFLVAFSLVLFIAIITRPFIVLFHELGHAIPAIIFTKEPVSVYLGSYGDPNRSFRVRLGLLEVWLGYRLIWLKGLCRHSRIAKTNQHAIVTIMGPITSLIIAAVSAYFVFSFDMHGFLKMMIFCFLFFSIFDLLVNIVPSGVALSLYDGSLIYNDGYQLSRILYSKRFPDEYQKAVALYNDRNYKKAAHMLVRFIKMNFHNDQICRMAVYALCETGKVDKAYDIHNILKREYTLNENDIATYSWIKEKLGISDV